jgi:hypothetical protein
MKWLFSILLIANLGIFIWLFPQQNGAASQGLQPPDVGELRLVDEPEVKPLDNETGNLAGAEPLESIAEAEHLGSTLPDEPAESPQLPPMVEPEEPGRVNSTLPAESPEPSSSPICASVGAFAKRSQAELLSVRLLAEGVKTDITAEASNEQAGFWVLIPPQPDRQAAIKIAEELEAAGVADLWRFTSGNLAHAISLGLFRDEERAQTRRDKIAALGFDTVVRPRYRERTLYWLNYQFSGQDPLTASYWQELSKEIPDLTRNQSTCP